ncbi:hypothetical protein [Streptomyces sp. NPDC048340]|uniref:hypothetical protein n=1 Tax=Streptomyces sp. NPDC048340 TaxID=3365537 RepID=UPI003717082C
MSDFTLAAPIDMSTGFSDFFATIGLTGSGLVTKATAAVLVVIALKMMGQLSGADPKKALRVGSMAVGTLFVAVILAMYGSTLFSTVTNQPTPPTTQQQPAPAPKV